MKFSFNSNLFFCARIKWMVLSLSFMILSGGNLIAQRSPISLKSVFTPADTFSVKRFYGITTAGSSIYVASSIGLYHAWYKDYPQTSFHFFNDLGEWEHMDKIGHFYTSWFQGYLVHSMMQWSGLNNKNAILGGIIAGTIFQSTIEVMDGFSEKWGFSASDIGSNILGTGLFAVQQYYWNEQRLILKFSSFPKKFDPDVQITGQGGTTSLNARSAALYGTTLPARVLKDYNAQTYWLTFNPKSFIQTINFPDWLSISLGYSPQNMFGGYANSWELDGVRYEIKDPAYARYHQFLVSPDINWEKIHTNSPFIRTLFKILNIIKMPAPAIEFNDLEGFQFRFHWLYY